MVSQKMQRLDELLRAFTMGTKNYFQSRTKGLSLFLSQLNALSPLAVLGRGYSITRKLPELMVVKNASSLLVDDQVEVRFHHGQIRAKVKSISAE